MGRGIVLLIALAVLVPACSASDDEEREAIARAEEAILGLADPENAERSFASLSHLAFEQPGALERAALEHVGATDRGVRIAVVHALASVASDPEAIAALERFATSEDVTERLLAATALVARGNRKGVPVLIDGLRETASMRYMDPPTQAWRFARNVLLVHVDQDPGLRGASDAAAAAEAAAEWEAWWSANGETYDLEPASPFRP